MSRFDTKASRATFDVVPANRVRLARAGQPLPADRLALVERATALYARCRNRLDAAPLIEALADDVVLESQNEWEPLSGKAAVAAYLEQRFEVLAGFAATRDTGRLELGVVDLPAADDHPCAIFVLEGRRVSLAVLRTDDAGAIVRIDFVTVLPSPAAARTSGIVPT